MNLPDGLMEQVRDRATTSGRTVTSLVEEALRKLLAEQREVQPPRRLTTDGKPGGRFLIDLEDKDALWAALDGPE